MRDISITLLAVLGGAEEDSCAQQRDLCSDNVLPHEHSQAAPSLLQMMRRAPAHFVHMQATGASTLDSLNESEVHEFFVPHHFREVPHFEHFSQHHEMNGARDHEHHELLAGINSAKEERRTSIVAANAGPKSEDPDEIKIAKVEMEPVQVVGEDYKIKDGLIPFQVANMSMKEMGDMSKVVMQFVAWLLFGNMVIIIVVCVWQAFSPRRKSLAASAELSKLSNEEQVTRSPQITSLAQLTALAQAPLLDVNLAGPAASIQSHKRDGIPDVVPATGIDTDVLKYVSSTSTSTGDDARRRSSSARRSSSSRASSRRRTSLSPQAKDDSRCLWTVDALCTPSTGRRVSA